jgi:hypothetical protein
MHTPTEKDQYQRTMHGRAKRMAIFEFISSEVGGYMAGKQHLPYGQRQQDIHHN